MKTEASASCFAVKDYCKRYVKRVYRFAAANETGASVLRQVKAQLRQGTVTHLV